MRMRNRTNAMLALWLMVVAGEAVLFWCQLNNDRVVMIHEAPALSSPAICEICTVMVVSVPAQSDYWNKVIDSLKMEVYATQSELRCHEFNTSTVDMWGQRFDSGRIAYWYRKTLERGSEPAPMSGCVADLFRKHAGKGE